MNLNSVSRQLAYDYPNEPCRVSTFSSYMSLGCGAVPHSGIAPQLGITGVGRWMSGLKPGTCLRGEGKCGDSGAALQNDERGSSGQNGSIRSGGVESVGVPFDSSFDSSQDSLRARSSTAPSRQAGRLRSG